jgi:hypothetical protein
MSRLPVAQIDAFVRFAVDQGFVQVFMPDDPSRGIAARFAGNGNVDDNGHVMYPEHTWPLYRDRNDKRLVYATDRNFNKVVGRFRSLPAATQAYFAAPPPPGEDAPLPLSGTMTGRMAARDPDVTVPRRHAFTEGYVAVDHTGRRRGM